MKRRLITAALPYVNNIPHLGNLIQVLSADVFARYCRSAGFETLYICGTDEYGTATETKALKEGVTPQALCERYHYEHRGIYTWFNINFDNFSRTSNPTHTKIVQDIFTRIDEAGYIHAQEDEQHYCLSCDRFLADRFVIGTCAHCGYNQARGDQCEHCGKVLDTHELKEPHCEVCGEASQLRTTQNLYIDLPALAEGLTQWMQESKAEELWAANALAMTHSWMRDGLKQRCITRDLKWGIPVPKAGFEDKVFYVWFDAPIGYISMTAELRKNDWHSWWQNPQHVELIQFIGKDNIPFHTVVFPSTLLATGQKWTMLHRMSSTEYLNYENGKFSKTRGVGVFGNDCIATTIDTDVWRFYLMYMRPEKSDTQFSWKGFKEVVNSELVGNFGNLVNRTLSFIHKFYDGAIPAGVRDEPFWQHVQAQEAVIIAHLEKAELKDALKEILALSDFGNKQFQAGEPWRTRTEEPARAVNLIFNLTYLILDLARLMLPFIPMSAQKIGIMLQGDLNWTHLGQTSGLSKLGTSMLLFEMLEEEYIEKLRLKFGGDPVQEVTQSPNKSESTSDAPASFASLIDLRVAKVTKVERHADADKLYILQLDLGDSQRQIVSSIVPYYKEEELLDKHIVVVANLKKSKFRGVESLGMLLAAEDEADNCEVIFTQAPMGSRVLPEGEADLPAKANIKIDDFDKFPMEAKSGVVTLTGKKMIADGHHLSTTKLLNAKIG
ncbi:methionine--tRNA ligase [Entomospira culicis]|uniref:Methionine--tRNA ligase n=1 Tax=Entomospira culicis TaxID=2719989 RepID=A0A968GE77_9SPIO|nr:methionine--tRNA ligase [Entomospira culicis]NIZ18698.1 methionine--tRNA ligase [Entomospira culicis]NIZ68913.1 methionine--tRNA ligase [Entomospira culicis]WDI37506.1 methionine--tRNA ligase [Entomospira culicis]WDI39134.1 methionine--tRNA ligase [Entomospira culicis]